MTLERKASLDEGRQLESGMTRDEIMAFFKRREAAYEDLDAKALAEDYAQDARIESPITGVHSAREAEKAFRVVFDAFLDLTMSFDAVVIDGDTVVTVMSAEATHMQDLLGFEPTGKHFQMSMAFVYRLKNRKIVHEQRIYDFTGLLVQIGVLKAKPAS